jgi:hypothetical protein
MYFGIIFLHNKFISETYLITLKKFQNAVNKLGRFKYNLLVAFYVMDIGFQSSFITEAAAF